MRKLIITILFTAITCSTYARNWSSVVSAISQVESKGNARAVNGDAVGLLQIRPILVKDINRILKIRKITKRYTQADRYSPQKSLEMFDIYQSFYNPSGNVEKAIRLWNGGSNYTLRGTEIYYKKVKKQMIYGRK